MNFDEVITAHSKWKSRLRAVIDGKETLDPQQVAKDDACDLGRWIYGEGKQFQVHPEFSVVRSEHQAFHKCAAEVVTQAKRGDRDGAQKAISAGSPFIRTSSSLVQTLVALRAKVEKR